MAVASFNRKSFEAQIGKVTDELLDKISLFCTPVESVSDDRVEVEVFPNRPDLLSLQGYIRAFKAFLGKSPGLKTYKVNSMEKDHYVTIDPSVRDVRPYTVCAVVHGLKFQTEHIEELIELQEKLHITMGRKRKKMAIGIYPLDKITFPITFKALEPDKIKFIPLGMKDELTGLQILQRHPTGKAYSDLLAGKSVFPVFIDAKNKVLSMPPIINSEETGKIEESTKDVFVECSGSDKESLNKALNIIATVLSEMGGKISAVEIRDGKTKILTPNLAPKTMKINFENINKTIGLSLNEKEIKQALEKMGFEYKNKTVTIPAWRTDILHEIDIIEDIAIGHGYEKLTPEIPSVATVGRENLNETIKRKISEILSGTGMLEVSSYHLTTKEDQYTKMSAKTTKDAREVPDAKTQYNILRKDLTHNIMKVLSENVDASYPQAIFETGIVFEGLKEREKLALAIAPGNITEIKQKIEYLANMMKIEFKISTPKEFPDWFIEGRVAQLEINEKIIGYFGEVHPRILKNWKIKMPVVLCELDLAEVFERVK